jgi:hypothetical protein
VEEIRYVSAPLDIVFSISNDEKYKKEFDILGISDEDSVGEWLKLAKARGETSESDQVLLTLIVELHRKLDALSAYVKGEKIEFLTLQESSHIQGIGYEHFKLESDALEVGENYYGRIEMPVFPKRQIPLFFIAISPSEAKLVLLHERDEKDWNAYLVARERAIIREMRAQK